MTKTAKHMEKLRKGFFEYYKESEINNKLFDIAYELTTFMTPYGMIATETVCSLQDYLEMYNDPENFDQKERDSFYLPLAS